MKTYNFFVRDGQGLHKFKSNNSKLSLNQIIAMIPWFDPEYRILRERDFVYLDSSNLIELKDSPVFMLIPKGRF